MIHSLFKSSKTSIQTGNSHRDNDVSENQSSRSNRRPAHRSGNRGGRRLERTQRIRAMRYSDDDVSNDTSRSSFFNTDHSSETASVSTWGSLSATLPIQCPRNDVAYLPLPPPLSSNGSLYQHSSQGNLPVSPPRSSNGYIRDSDEKSGYSTDSASSDGSFKSSASRGIFSTAARRSEGDLQSLQGMHIGSPAGVVTGFQRLDEGYGHRLQIHTNAVKVQKSAPNSTHTSPVSSPKAWGSSLASLRSTYDKSTWPDAHPLPLPPTLNTPPASPRTSLLSPRSSIIPPWGSSKSDAEHTVSKWQKGRLLGSGAFGRVYKGIHCETGEFCAIKEVAYIEDDTKSRESAKQLEQEIKLLSSLRHPNIVHYKGSDMVNGYLNIYLELVTGGSIYKLCQEFKKLQEPVVRRYTRQILHGLHYLHCRNTVHRDIKGANLLVDQEGTVKLADFGMAKQIKQQGADLLSFKGSPYWMAPEVIMQKKTGFECAVDIWSLGCTVLEMITGKPPWNEYEGVAAMFKVTRAEIPPLPRSLSLEGQSFIKLCLQRDAADRPSAADLLQHPFVQIPSDVPDLTMQAINIPNVLFSGNEERSTMQENSGNSIWLLKGGSQPLNKRQYSRRRLQPDICPSRSAPVSPRSSHSIMNELSSAGFSPLPGFSTPAPGSPQRAGFSTPPAGSPRGTGFSTPPEGSPRGTGFSRSPAGSPRVAGFDFYANHKKSPIVGGVSAWQQAHPNHRLPSSSGHDVVSRSESPWDVAYENRQISHNGESRSNGLPSSSVHNTVIRHHSSWDVECENRQTSHKGKQRSNGFYKTEDVWSYKEEEQDNSRWTYGTLQGMDEKVTQVFLDRSPHRSPRRNERVF